MPKVVHKSMIDSPYEHCHSSFADQREYELHRAIIDTGDDEADSTVILVFRHPESGRRRIFHFSGVNFAHGCVAMMTDIRGFLPIYVATLDGRQLEGHLQIEVGDTDPGHAWFWAQAVYELGDNEGPLNPSNSA